MDPSSLIFVVLVGVWAVYLLGHWVRRRDMLATARSIDRFSEAMRVLERRPPQPLATPRSGGYVVPPIRLAMATAPAAGPVVAPVRTTARAAHPVDAPAGAAGSPSPVAPPEAAAAAARSRVVAASTSRRRPARRDSASTRARALVLMTLLVLVPLAWVVAMVTAVPGWLPLVLTVALVAHVVRLRRAAMRQRAATRRAARADRTTPQQVTPGGARPSARRLPRSRQAAADGGTRGARATRSATEVGAARPTPEDSPGRHRAEVPANESDDASDDRAHNGTGDARQATDDAPRRTDDQSAPSRRPITVEGEWQPVPVPPPTYTLKPKAPAPVRRPVAAASSVGAPANGPGAASAAARTGDSSAGGHAPTFDLDAILERRIASGG